MKSLTLGDVLDFVLANKGNKTFLGMSKERIGYLLQKGMHDETLLVSVDNQGNINGMILAEIRPEQKVLFIIENLAMTKANLCMFARIGKIRFPGLKLEWLKNGKHKQHNTDKIYSKLCGSIDNAQFN